MKVQGSVLAVPEVVVTYLAVTSCLAICIVNVPPFQLVLFSWLLPGAKWKSNRGYMKEEVAVKHIIENQSSVVVQKDRPT